MPLLPEELPSDEDEDVEEASSSSGRVSLGTGRPRTGVFVLRLFILVQASLMGRDGDVDDDAWELRVRVGVCALRL